MVVDILSGSLVPFALPTRGSPGCLRYWMWIRFRRELYRRPGFGFRFGRSQARCGRWPSQRAKVHVWACALGRLGCMYTERWRLVGARVDLCGLIRASHSVGGALARLVVARRLPEGFWASLALCIGPLVLWARARSRSRFSLPMDADEGVAFGTSSEVVRPTAQRYLITSPEEADSQSPVVLSAAPCPPCVVAARVQLRGA